MCEPERPSRSCFQELEKVSYARGVVKRYFWQLRARLNPRIVEPTSMNGTYCSKTDTIK
jgi:hypothetical protein